MKKINYVALLIFLVFQLQCKRSIICDDNSTSMNYSNTELNLTSQSMNQLFPEIGKVGGIGKSGNPDNGFRGNVYKHPDGKWYIEGYLGNITIGKGINTAEIYIYCWISDNTFRGYKLNRKGKGGYYYLNGANIPFQNIKRSGYFHIISTVDGIDFKIGFGMSSANINGFTINGRSIGNGMITINRGGALNIKLNSISGLYYRIHLHSIAGSYEIYNYYAPDGNISVGKEYISRTLGYVTVFVYAHNVYIPAGFKSFTYPNGDKSVPAVSTNGGGSFLVSTIIKVI